jgi:predicted RNase H-related nuclease YkuK (DUF458 family)
MTWKAEAKEVKQKVYGAYCSLCYKYKLNPKPYHAFEIADYSKLKQILPAGSTSA